MTNQSSRRKLVLSCVVVGMCLSGLWYGWAWGNRVGEETLLVGRQLFEHEWRERDPLAANGDGLGPVFNARSCAECHFQGGVGGGGPNEKNVVAFAVMPSRRDPLVRLGVVHASATSQQFSESRDVVRQLFPIVPGGVRVINGCSTTVADFDPVEYTSINTPPLFGLALIEEISDFALFGNGASRSVNSMSRGLDGDFSTMPVGRLRSLSAYRTGRFGWKAQFATLEEFVAAACAVELGLTNPLRQQDIPRRHVPDPNAGLDLDKKQLRALVAFVASLPRPTQILPSDPQALSQVRHGEDLFASVGCADCHTPNLGSVEGVYSDLRLYDLQPRGSNSSYVDVIPEVPFPSDEPKPAEWKTPPLWGVADSAPYFHDGGSFTLESAILRHDGHGKESKKKFTKLQSTDQKALIAFLRTLRAPQIAIASKQQPSL